MISVRQTLNFRERQGVGGNAVILGLSQFLQQLQGTGFYGVVEIQFQDGDIVLVRKQESFKPSAFLVVE